MGKTSDSGSIFDFAGKAYKKKAASPKEAVPLPPAPIPSEVEAKPLEIILQDMRERQQELQKKLESAYSLSGLTPASIDQTLERVKETAMWSEAQEKKQKLEVDVAKALGKSLPKSRTSGERKEDKKTKKRKGKMLGGRKGWISMQQ